MKKCEVISYNEYREVVVFKYEETEVQMHYHFDSVPEFIYVTKDGDKFEISLARKTVNKLQRKPKLKTVETELVYDTVADTKSV